MTDAPAPASAPAPAPLPELRGGLLAHEEVEQLLADIAGCGELLAVIPKYGARDYVPGQAALTLADARAALAGRTVRGLQLRYRHAGAEWWDTLMIVGERFRLVRIRQEWAASP